MKGHGKNQANLPANQRTLKSFFGKKTFANVNKMQMLEIKLKLTIDSKTANGLDSAIPGSNSSSSLTVDPLNESSNISITVNANESQDIGINTTQVAATVSSTCAVINVSASLSRKCHVSF